MGYDEVSGCRQSRDELVARVSSVSARCLSLMTAFRQLLFVGVEPLSSAMTFSEREGILSKILLFAQNLSIFCESANVGTRVADT